MNKYKKLLSNTVILGIGTFGSKLLVLLLMPLYTHYLSPAEYGLADLIAQAANLLIPLAALGLYNGVFRFVADKQYDKTAVFSTGATLLLGGTLGFLVLSPLLFLIGAFEGRAWLIPLYVLAAAWHYLLSYYLRADDRAALFAGQGIVNTALTITLNIVFLVVFDMGVLGYVLSVVLSDILVSLGLVLIVRFDRIYSIKKYDREMAASLLKYSLPMIPATVFWWITDVSDRFLVKEISGATVNGIYAVAYKIPTLLTLVSGVFVEAWQFSSVTESTDREEYGKFFGTVYENFLALMFLAGSGLVWLDRWLCSWMFDAEYFTAWRSIPLLLLATVFTSLVTFLGSVYMVRLKSMRSFWTAMVGAGLNIVLNLILIPRYAEMGAAFATFVSYFVVFVIRIIDARVYIRFNIHALRTALNLLILGGQTVILLYEVRGWFWIELGGVCLMAILNLRPLLRAIGPILGSFLKKIKKN